MSSPVFLDANVFVYAGGEAPQRELCLSILEACGSERLKAQTSAAVVEEVWHVELSGRGVVERGLGRNAYLAMRPVLPVTDESLALAFELDLPSLGPMDRLHVATCMLNEITHIVSADRGFDSVPQLSRVDPTDPEQVEALLA